MKKTNKNELSYYGGINYCEIVPSWTSLWKRISGEYAIQTNVTIEPSVTCRFALSTLFPFNIRTWNVSVKFRSRLNWQFSMASSKDSNQTIILCPVSRRSYCAQNYFTRQSTRFLCVPIITFARSVRSVRNWFYHRANENRECSALPNFWPEISVVFVCSRNRKIRNLSSRRFKNCVREDRLFNFECTPTVM